MPERETHPARYPLHLTSPHQRGDLVRHVQHYLSKNRHQHEWFHVYGDEPSGIYDERTASAVHHAKFWLGYPRRNVNSWVRSADFLGYLVPHDHRWYKPLPPLFRERHGNRINPPPGEKALAYAERYVGYGPTNCSMFASWYGLPCDAWCAMFVSYCFAHSGYSGFRYSYVPNILHDASYGINHLAITHDPKPGDVAIFVWGGPGSNPSGDHTGLVRSVTSSSVESIDGNTGSGEVLHRLRSRTLVRAFVRVLH